MKKSEEWRSTL